MSRLPQRSIGVPAASLPATTSAVGAEFAPRPRAVERFLLEQLPDVAQVQLFVDHRSVPRETVDRAHVLGVFADRGDGRCRVRRDDRLVLPLRLVAMRQPECRGRYGRSGPFPVASVSFQLRG